MNLLCCVLSGQVYLSSSPHLPPYFCTPTPSLHWIIISAHLQNPLFKKHNNFRGSYVHIFKRLQRCQLQLKLAISLLSISLGPIHNHVYLYVH